VLLSPFIYLFIVIYLHIFNFAIQISVTVWSAGTKTRIYSVTNETETKQSAETGSELNRRACQNKGPHNRT